LATATTFFVAFVGFVFMLGAALWFERSFRKLGRAGMQQLSQSFRSGGLREYFGSTSQRMKDRFRRDE
jgi:hypothetical protein